MDLGLVDALAQLTFTVHDTLVRIAARHDVSIAQTRLLGILRDRRPTIKELAGFLQVDKSSMTGLVDRAEQRGLVERASSTLDRRSVLVAITTAGRSLIDVVAADFEAEIAYLVSDLSSTQQNRLSAATSLIVVADARRRGVEILQVDSATGAQTAAGASSLDLSGPASPPTEATANRSR
jgi:MarR family transcriptional regulator, lower aerobic nicotinate degradation pathway regulator